jgi:undecaprenyl diphosphate synthase
MDVNGAAAGLEAIGALMPGVDADRIPVHVAMIMDGNGRWAQARGLPRVMGHKEGAKTVRRVLEASARIGVEVLTLYSFSTENWKRPRDEVGALMEMCIAYCASEAAELAARGVRVRVIGSREGMPGEVLDALDRLVEATSGGERITLCLAINYGSRDEIARAARTLAQRAAAGEIDPGSIDEEAVAGALSTGGLPDPDLLIRTGGEMRLSNYLLWELSYAEIMVTETAWPEFSEGEYFEMVGAYTRRSRRFGHAHEKDVVGGGDGLS